MLIIPVENEWKRGLDCLRQEQWGWSQGAYVIKLKEVSKDLIKGSVVAVVRVFGEGGWSIWEEWQNNGTCLQKESNNYKTLVFWHILEK